MPRLGRLRRHSSRLAFLFSPQLPSELVRRQLGVRRVPAEPAALESSRRRRRLVGILSMIVVDFIVGAHHFTGPIVALRIRGGRRRFRGEEHTQRCCDGAAADSIRPTRDRDRDRAKSDNDREASCRQRASLCNHEQQERRRGEGRFHLSDPNVNSRLIDRSIDPKDECVANARWSAIYRTRSHSPRLVLVGEGRPPTVRRKARCMAL